MQEEIAEEEADTKVYSLFNAKISTQTLQHHQAENNAADVANYSYCYAPFT